MNRISASGGGLDLLSLLIIGFALAGVLVVALLLGGSKAALQRIASSQDTGVRVRIQPVIMTPPVRARDFLSCLSKWMRY